MAVKNEEQEKGTLSKIYDWGSENVGGILGAAQVFAGLLSANKNEVPESNISDQLKNLSREVRQRAAYGLNPGEKTIAENNIKNIQQNEIDAIKELSGGSVDVALANIAKSTNRTHDALSSLQIKDAELKEQKQLGADQIIMKAIESDEKEFNRSYQRYLDNENAVSNLIGSGISNIVGESKLKKTNEQLQGEIDDNTSVLKSILENNKKADTTIEKTEEVIDTKIDPKNIYDIINTDLDNLT